MWKIKKWIFSKNCLTLFVSGRDKNAHFRAHYLFWPKHFWAQNSVKTRKHYKNSGFNGNCHKPKMTPFFLKKVFFLTWVKKVGFTNCVFEKLCFFFWKHYFYSVFRKHASCNIKLYADKKTENLWKKWVVFEHGKKVFFGLFFFRL